MKKNIIIGICGGIAAYKMIDLAKKLVADKHHVEIILTKSAIQIASFDDFKKSGIAVHTDLFKDNFDYKSILEKREVDHIKLADKADVFIIAPATANTIAKIAHGIADDFLTTTLLATSAPIVICPSMNVNMWNNEATQTNIQTLIKRGYKIIDPDEGDLACGYTGVGRLPEISQIAKKIEQQLISSSLLVGKNVVVTAGATREYIDDVRFISNQSSGKMGLALAQSCRQSGANVALLHAGRDFETSSDLSELLKKHIPAADICFHTAAIGDFVLSKQYKGKIDSQKRIKIELTPQKKLGSEIKKLNPKIKLIIFKAEWGGSEKNQIEKAHTRLVEYNADVIALNDVSKKDRGFGVDTNEVIIIFPNKKTIKVPFASKQEIANTILLKIFG